MDHAPYIDVAGTLDKETKKVSLFVFNRDLAKAREVEINWEDAAPSHAVEALILAGDDLKAFNTFEVPQRVAPRTLEKPATNGTRTRFEAPPRSYSLIQWSL